jgi:hypothetical protein
MYYAGAGTGFSKSDWYSVWQGTRKWDLFGERNTEIHRNQRRLVANIYSLSNMKKLEPYVDSAIGVFITKMAEMSGQQVDISYWTHLFGFGSFSHILFLLLRFFSNGNFRYMDQDLMRWMQM